MKIWETIREKSQPEEERRVKELLSEMETVLTKSVEEGQDSGARTRVSQIITASVELLRALTEREHNAYSARKRELLLLGYRLGQLIAKANGEMHMNVGIKSTDRALVPWKMPA